MEAHFSPDQMVTGYEQVYRDCLSRNATHLGDRQAAAEVGSSVPAANPRLPTG